MTEDFRENIFWENLKTISRHNYEFRRGKTTFKMGINQFADMTFQEYSDMFKPNETMQQKAKEKSVGLKFNPNVIFRQKNETLPANFDWRDQGALTQVKDQKSCGACYAMSTVGAIESQLFIKTGKLVELSEQEILDCAGDAYNSFQCAGGLAFKVFEYVKDKGGLSGMKEYPYKGEAGECRVAENKVEIKIKGYGYVLCKGDENVLMKAVTEIGPIVVAIDIDHESFMRYSSGIYSEDKCTEEVNHGALLVGYGTENGVDYWIIKNSFGVTWGESGYFRILRGLGKDCSVMLSPIYPVLMNKNEKKLVKVLNPSNFNFTAKSFQDFISKFKNVAVQNN